MKQSLPSLPRVSSDPRSSVTTVFAWLPLVDATGPFWMSEALGELQKSDGRSRKKILDVDQGF